VVFGVGGIEDSRSSALHFCEYWIEIPRERLVRALLRRIAACQRDHEADE